MRDLRPREILDLFRTFIAGGRFLKATPHLSREEMRGWQWKRISALVRHAFKNVPFYRDLYTQAGFQTGDRLNDNELKKSIISAIGDLVSYQLPDAKGYTSMMRYITRRTDDIRQQYRDQVLSTNGEDFISFGEALAKVAQSDAVVVLGSQSALENSKAGLKVSKVK